MRHVSTSHGQHTFQAYRVHHPMRTSAAHPFHWFKQRCRRNAREVLRFRLTLKPTRTFATTCKPSGLKNDQNYKAWCRQHGFSGRLYKDWRQQQRERLFASREIAAARLEELRKKAKSPETIVDTFTGRLPLVEAHSPLLLAIRRVGEAASRDRNVKEKLLSLLLHVQHRTDFLNTGPALSSSATSPAILGLTASWPWHTTGVCG